MRLSLYSTVLMPEFSAHWRSASVRFSTKGWRTLAIPGIITFFITSFLYSRRGISVRSDSSTKDREWEIRVDSRSSTGVSNRSDSSYPSLVKARHSAESQGSSMGTLAAMA